VRAQARPEGRPASAALLRPCLQVGLEGIVSKRKDSGTVRDAPDWLKMKNPEASAVKREAEEDLGKGGDRT
jgi:ATP-dependent DNA ligase